MTKAGKIIVGEDGRILLSVSFDGSWTTWGYSSLVGTGTYIGLFTGLPLFTSSRCKVCRICQDHQRRSPSTQVRHSCHQNWKASSGAMEANIAVEGAKALAMALDVKVRIGTLVGDGDAKIDYHLSVELPDHLWDIERYLDKNHIVKNFTKKMYVIHSRYKGTGKFTTGMIPVMYVQFPKIFFFFNFLQIRSSKKLLQRNFIRKMTGWTKRKHWKILLITTLILDIWIVDLGVGSEMTQSINRKICPIKNGLKVWQKNLKKRKQGDKKWNKGESWLFCADVEIITLEEGTLEEAVKIKHVLSEDIRQVIQFYASEKNLSRIQAQVRFFVFPSYLFLPNSTYSWSSSSSSPSSLLSCLPPISFPLPSPLPLSASPLSHSTLLSHSIFFPSYPSTLVVLLSFFLSFACHKKSNLPLLSFLLSFAVPYQ